MDSSLPLWAFLWGAGCRRLPISDESGVPSGALQMVESWEELAQLQEAARGEGGAYGEFARHALWYLIDSGLLETWLREAVGDLALGDAAEEIRIHGGAVKASRFLGRSGLHGPAHVEPPPSARDHGAWLRFAEVLATAIARTRDPRERRELVAALAAIHEEHLGDISAALHLEQQLYAEDPFDGDAAGHVERLGRALGREVEVNAFFRAVASSPAAGMEHASSFPEGAPAAVAPSLTESREELEAAVAEQRALLRDDPRRVEAYHALRRIYAREGNVDAVWCLCAALACLGGANPEEKAFLKRYPAIVPDEPSSLPATWPMLLLHPDAPPSVGAVFDSVWRTAALRWADAPEYFGLHRRERLDCKDELGQFAEVLNRCLRAVGSKLGDLYVRQLKPVGLHLYNTQVSGALVPSLVVGSDFIDEPSLAKQTFLAARKAVLLRPDCYLRFALPSDALRVVLLAALKLARPDRATELSLGHTEAPAVTEYLHFLVAMMHVRWRELIVAAVDQLVASGASLDVERWSAGVDYTADRVGLVLSSDLAGALHAIGLEPTPTGDRSANARRRELLLYAVSDEYFAARQQFGAAIA